MFKAVQHDNVCYFHNVNIVYLCFSKRNEEPFHYDWSLKYMLFLGIYFHVFFTGVLKMHC